MFRHCLLATTAVTALAVPGVVAPARAAAGPVPGCLSPSPSACYAPRQFLTAYGIQPLLDHGIDGGGQTALVRVSDRAVRATMADRRVPAEAVSPSVLFTASGGQRR